MDLVPQHRVYHAVDTPTLPQPPNPNLGLVSAPDAPVLKGFA